MFGMTGVCPQGGRGETFSKSFLRESGHSGMIVEVVKQIHLLNSVTLGLPLRKLLNTSFIQEISYGAIGVTNPYYSIVNTR
jgi:hypothetical protein